MRESHKFVIVHAIDAIRSRLLEVGAGLVAAGRIDRVDDLFFLDLAELERGLADPGHDLRGPIDAGRARRLRGLPRHGGERGVPAADPLG